MSLLKIAWYGIHSGEEPPLVPAGGIFFSGCHLKCVYCQNYQISQPVIAGSTRFASINSVTRQSPKDIGHNYTTGELVKIMLDLQKQGSVNIDLVTPTIWWEEIKEAIILAKQNGLQIPIVWNSNGYESVDILQQMEGLVDIYLPDFKYSDDVLAEKYSGIKNYTAITEKAIREMWRQVGKLQACPESSRRIENGVAKKGLIVRHLILPNTQENSFGVLEKLARISTDIHVSLMSQYFPVYKAKDYPEINKTLLKEEFEKVYEKLQDLGFENGWVQGFGSQTNLLPDFNRVSPFS